MAFDGLVTKSIVSELNNCLINGKINKIFEPNKNEVILGVYSIQYLLKMIYASSSLLQEELHVHSFVTDKPYLIS